MDGVVCEYNCGSALGDEGHTVKGVLNADHWHDGIHKLLLSAKSQLLQVNGPRPFELCRGGCTRTQYGKCNHPLRNNRESNL